MLTALIDESVTDAWKDNDRMTDETAGGGVWTAE
jgi:hypothetical protein